MAKLTDEQLNGMARYIGDKILPVIKLSLQNATRCCPNCEHFEGGKLELCKLNGKHPPATVIAFGCEMFADNEVPF